MRLRTVLLVVAAGLVVWDQAGARVVVWGPRVVGAGPLGSLYLYPDPYPHEPSSVAGDKTAPVYMESLSVPPAAQRSWYYCEAPKGYHPYVSRRSRDFMQVVPQALSAR